MSTQTTTSGPTRGVIIVGVDGSESSRRALLWAQSMTALTSSTVEAVRAWVPHTPLGVMAVGPDEVPPTSDPARDALRNLVADVTKVFGEHRPEGLHLSVRQGSPAEVLIDASRTAQLLVVGSRGYGGFTGLLLGSVSSACSAHAHCPVVVMHGDTPTAAPTAATG